MKNDFFAKMLLSCLVCSLAAVAGCCIQIGCGVPLAKYERTVQLSEPMPAGSVFTAQTHNGSITITGAGVPDCNVTATIIARAGSEEDARRVAEETRIKLESFGKKLALKIERPRFLLNQSVQVNLNAKVPNRIDAELTTHNGALKIKNITGQVNGTTHNSKVVAERLCGTIKLRAHNGSISCKETSGDVKLKTHNGRINAAYSEDASPVCDASLITHNGSINFTAPASFSTTVDVSTHNGSINTELPITVIGKVSRRKLSGTIGTGQGKLNLETHNGSIRLR
ncbi:MAG: DUF4097 family beta strand repeat protein [Sedimentisphaerales bacterium]|nr:DUF4097 family beta strand repeat protein [Sedimentisphaerales bacterium]